MSAEEVQSRNWGMLPGAVFLCGRVGRGDASWMPAVLCGVGAASIRVYKGGS